MGGVESAMTRASILFLLLVVLPGGVLAAFAFALAEREHEADVQTLETRLDGVAREVARRAEKVLEAARQRARDRLERGRRGAAGGAPPVPGDVVAFVSTSGALRFTNATSPGPASLDDRHDYDLSVRGGESYEFERKAPERAIDAYSFFLPRIRSPQLRARLRLRIARAALAAGHATLGAALLDELTQEDFWLETEGGLPIATLAAWRRAEERADTGEARFRLAELVALVEERQSLEAAVGRAPEILEKEDIVCDGTTLLVASGAPGNRRIVREPFAFPVLSAPETRVRFEGGKPPGSATASPTSPGSQRTVRDVAYVDGRPLLTIAVEESGYAERLGELDRRRWSQHGLVAFLVLGTLAGGFGFLRALARERHLARLRRDLLANVTHELKTPITSIRMFSEMLAEDPLDEGRTRRFGRLLRAESLRLSQLIENVLDVSRQRGRGEDLELEPVDVAAVLRRVSESFRFRALEKGVAFSCEVAEESRSSDDAFLALTNAPALERITLNLLDNALKYRRRDDAAVILRAKPSDGGLEVAVVDNGPGVPRSEQEKVFEEFYRARYDDYAVRGSGLGLAIARRLAENLGGRLTLESREGVGSTFTLMVPGRPGGLGASERKETET